MPIVATVMSCGQSQNSGIRTENLDTTVRPADDFYQFACGGWMKNNPLPDEFSRFGSFDKVADDTRQQLNELLTNLTKTPQEPGTVAYKIATLYNQVMDTARLNAEGYKPIEADLQKIRAISSLDEVIPMMVKLDNKGVNGYLGFFLEIDPKDSRNYITYVWQGSLSLDEREYYIDTDENTVNIRNKFREHVAKVFEMVGYDAATANRMMEDVLRIETRMAKASKSSTELRDTEANYNRTDYADLCKKYPNLKFDAWCNEMGINDMEYVNLCQPDYIAELNKLVAEESLEAQKAYLEWRYIDAADNYLSDEFRIESFNFYEKVMSGVLEESPRWKRAVRLCSSSLGEAVGQLYVEKYFPASHKERMLKLVNNLKDALRERIMAQTWMSDSTKATAVEKLGTYYVKIGYPDKWRDYSHLDINADKSLWENIMTINVSENQYWVKKHYKQPVDRDEWGMTPQTVNAYYNPSTNEITFPAGILQYPFFDMQADDAFNYGAIGVVIGHEMTHGFDDDGRKFDKDGNMHEWWAQGDAEKFEAHVTPLVEFFNNIEVLDGLKANGELTLGENLADHGGLQVAYQAFLNATKDAPLPVKDGFTPQQRFFLAYANVWANNIRDEEIRVRTKSDPHSLGRWRVNGTLPHINAWYEAFDVKEGDKMFVPENERVDIW
ncbi:MAG: M13 family metallopeptidase [Salinivirgaceae bacterium]|nr:M13 family metallopeptidase [Salinivirgaceae bacterium]